MNISRSLIAASVIAVLPLSAFAGDKDKAMTTKGTTPLAQFQALDTNLDGRLSPMEATSDPQLVFATVDKNSDGFIDSSEYMHRNMTNDSSMPRSDDSKMPGTVKPIDPTTDTSKPRQ